MSTGYDDQGEPDSIWKWRIRADNEALVLVRQARHSLFTESRGAGEKALWRAEQLALNEKRGKNKHRRAVISDRHVRRAFEEYGIEVRE